MSEERISEATASGVGDRERREWYGQREDKYKIRWTHTPDLIHLRETGEERRISEDDEDVWFISCITNQPMFKRTDQYKRTPRKVRILEVVERPPIPEGRLADAIKWYEEEAKTNTQITPWAIFTWLDGNAGPDAYDRANETPGGSPANPDTPINMNREDQ